MRPFRLSMYATMGYVVPEYLKWPGYLPPSMGLKFSDAPNGLVAISKAPGNGWATSRPLLATTSSSPTCTQVSRVPMALASPESVSVRGGPQEEAQL